MLHAVTSSDLNGLGVGFVWVLGGLFEYSFKVNYNAVYYQINVLIKGDDYENTCSGGLGGEEAFRN